MSDELQRLLDRVHDGVTTFDFDGAKTPCILIDESRYDALIPKIAGDSVSIMTDLNILQDGLGHVFVEIVLTFSKWNITETFLVNANTDYMFFESLAKTSMLAIASPQSHYGRSNTFMIQLPRPEKAFDALDIIRKALNKKEG